MLSIIFIILTSMIISMIMMTGCSILSKKSEMDREKTSPFECGFDPFKSPRTPFSIQFFLLAVLFLIFDIEIAITLPIIITMKWMLTGKWVLTISLFMIILIGGLMHEWKNGVLEWSK
uniref:NADH-ubiquinone oxidoreductase chain 3 n=1 Tax=Brachyplatys subaeneus TaxID=355284 RepID=A0A2P1CM44_9HEMI|nr:NADH dehydrogenase subunit 3 [Brachyplatys subaeneus]AVJ52394.1 NADH dehydrogenase subunit 3 [Brachyplatys subaeneus]UCC45915.1 NADH dehydrogenase subunit 3 [Brachyplatys subaeneus]